MLKVTTAAKPYKCEKCGKPIAKGEQYRSWIPGFRMKRRIICNDSQCTPKPSQMATNNFDREILTASEYVQEIARQVRLQSYTTTDQIEDDLDRVADDIDRAGEDEQEKFDNMPESLQGSPQGEKFEERVSKCEEIAQNLRDPEWPDALDTDDDVLIQEYWDKVAEAIEGIDISV